MRRCLWPGRLLRTGHGTVISEPPGPWRLTRLRVQIRHSSIATALTPEERSLIASYKIPKLSPVEWHARSDPEAWIPYLEQCAQTHQEIKKPANPPESRRSLMQSKDELDRAFTLMGHLWTARKAQNLSLLVHLGFRRKQWSTVYALLSVFADTYELLMPYMVTLGPQTGFDWPTNGKSLDYFLRYEHKGNPIKPIQSDAMTLDDLTEVPVLHSVGQRFLAELLQNVGSLVLAAADHSQEESKLAMSCVYRILARLHGLGLISDRVYQFSDTDPSLLSCRPPGLHLLSGHIMTVLSDAAWKEHESALTAAATKAGEDPPYLPLQMGVRELGPEIWFELILWCCVEHGFAKHGAKLIEEMLMRTGEHAWKAESWAPLLRTLDVVKQTNISTEQSWRRPESNSPPRVLKGPQKPPFNGLGRRTISSEVIASIRSGLFNQAYNGVGYSGSLPPDLLKRSASLTSVLESSTTKDDLRPTNRMSTSHIFRMLDSGSIRLNQDPTTFEGVLQSTQDLVPPWDGSGIVDGDELRDLTRAQIYDQSAAMAGLLEYTVRASATHRRLEQAFHQFAWLLNIVDASKVQHIRAFFESLGQSKVKDVSFFSDSQQLNPRVQESSLPQVSLVTLASLLDLATSSRSYRFGNWLLFNKDVDGPPISKSLYGDQALAPSILRFAAATRNAKLSEQVLASLEMPLSVNTLKALLNYHVAMGEWDRVIMTLKYLRDYRLKAWGFSNLMALAAKIIRLHASVEGMRKHGEVDGATVRSLEQAQDILRQIYRREYHTPASKNRRVNDYQTRQLLRVRQVFETLPPPLSTLMQEIKFDRPITRRNKIHAISDSSFNELVAAIVDTHGFAAAWRVCTRWCNFIPPPERVRQKEGGVSPLFTRDERNHIQGDPNFNAAWYVQKAKKAVQSNLNTIRIVAQAAHKELNELLANTSASSPSTSQEDTTSKSSPSPPSPPPPPTLFGDKQRKHPYQLAPPTPAARYFTLQGEWPSTDAEYVLDRCFCLYVAAGLTINEVECELPGYVDRMRQRGLLTWQARTEEICERFREMKVDPWMKFTGLDRMPVPVPVPEPEHVHGPETETEPTSTSSSR